MRCWFLVLLTWALAFPGWSQGRFDAEGQWRLAEGSVSPGPERLQGRFVSLFESYLIVDPVITAGFEGRGPGWNLGAGIRGLFPHPLAGETRLWPLVWGEVDLGWFGGRFDLGLGFGGFPPEGFTRWVPALVPSLAVFASVPPWSLSAGRLEWQPRLSLTARGFVTAQPVWAANPYTLGLSAGFVTHF